MGTSGKVGPWGGEWVGHLRVRSSPLTASRGNAHRSVRGLSMCIIACMSRAESFLPVVVPKRTATTQAIATHDVVDIAALDVTIAKFCVGRGMWVGTIGAKAEAATVDEDTFR
jgi:hypothetical protein